MALQTQIEGLYSEDKSQLDSGGSPVEGCSNFFYCDPEVSVVLHAAMAQALPLCYRSTSKHWISVGSVGRGARIEQHYMAARTMLIC